MDRKDIQGPTIDVCLYVNNDFPEGQEAHEILQRHDVSYNTVLVENISPVVRYKNQWFGQLRPGIYDALQEIEEFAKSYNK